MKKLVLLVMGALSMSFVNAQDITDALRYSSDEIKGTARFRALSGAFGALGGDMSAVSLNPAGSAIFNHSSASFSLSNFDTENETSYFNSINTTSDSNFDFTQAGGVFVFNNRNSSSPWRKFVLGFTYDRTANYDNAFLASGTNTNNSIGDFFLANAQGLRLDEISAFPDETISDAYQEIGSAYGYINQQAFLGYESYILEPDADDDANTIYTSNIGAGTYDQDFSYITSGYKGKFSVNIATQYEDNLYLGLNLNSHYINYNRSTFLYETNANAGSLVTEVGFENNLATTGNGFSFQLGAISKLTNDIRIGITYDSPTWYTITDETTQYIEALRDESGPTWAVIDPQVVNVFPDYKLQTPAKITGSLALMLDRKGFLSFDYSRKDYSKTKFTPEDDSYFAAQNSIIANSLKAANTYRIGGELRQNKFSFRGGYKIEESPYQDTSFYGDLKGFSLGIGYNFGGSKLDLAYENTKRTFNHQLYEVGLTDTATIDANNSNLTLTLSVSL